MQLREFKTVLGSLGAALAGDEGKLVGALAAALPDRAGTVAALLNAAGSTMTEASKVSQGPRLGDALPILERASALVQTIAKQAVISDYQLLLEWVKERPRVPMAAIAQLAPAPATGAGQAAAVREDVVREHVERLGAARPGGQAFGDALDTLAGDARVRKQEMVAITRKVADSNLAASTTKAAALKRVRLPHDAYLDSAARSDAIGGARRHRHT